uniref:Uncharacterized protein n=1 Tax=Rhizophagus irregularis (strain DAOM 181602 / DAOM 197198 / MUCL 43194) TaxID=747089 RepID=U9TRX3_RHIID
MDIKVSAFLKLTKLEFTESRTEIPGFLVLDETKLKTKWHLKKKIFVFGTLGTKIWILGDESNNFLKTKSAHLNVKLTTSWR